MVYVSFVAWARAALAAVRQYPIAKRLVTQSQYAPCLQPPKAKKGSKGVRDDFWCISHYPAWAPVDLPSSSNGKSPHHIPLATCAACRKTSQKSEITSIVISASFSARCAPPSARLKVMPQKVDKVLPRCWHLTTPALLLLGRRGRRNRAFGILTGTPNQTRSRTN